MNRLEEINAKHDHLRPLLERHKTSALWLRRTRNIAWFTAGADASIVTASETGVYSILVTENKRFVYADNIEAARIHAEDNLEALGFDYSESPWFAPKLPHMNKLLTDDAVIEDEIQKLRWIMSDGEKDRLRQLGQDNAAALEEASRAVRPGNTEYEIAALIDAAVRKRGAVAVVNLVATDERISKFRHPLPTGKKLDKYAMLVCCARREGLIISTTRLAHFGPLPAELKEKLHKVAAIDATTMVATQPGRTLGDVFADLQAAYAEQGEAGQWENHHQGGIGGYIARERIATPGDKTLIHAGQVYAWNPSVVGCKSEDTMLLGKDDFEIVSAHSSNWPTVEIDCGGKKVKRPGILEL
jgi:Xaa-Pro aminopeptidase